MDPQTPISIYIPSIIPLNKPYNIVLVYEFTKGPRTLDMDL